MQAAMGRAACVADVGQFARRPLIHMEFMKTTTPAQSLRGCLKGVLLLHCVQLKEQNFNDSCVYCVYSVLKSDCCHLQNSQFATKRFFFEHHRRTVQPIDEPNPQGDSPNPVQEWFLYRLY
ncbi:hypothetical protein ACQKEU_05475 [Acidovorax sp. NPDC077664]